MPSRENKIRELKLILEKAKNFPRRKDFGLCDFDMEGEVLDAMSDASEEKLYELKEDIWAYLTDPYAIFRGQAVRTLGWNTRMCVPDFKEKAYEIWRSDPDEDVKCSAIGSVGQYYSETKDKKILEEFYSALDSRLYSNRIRAHLLNSIMEISGEYRSPAEGYPILELGDCETVEEFEKSVNWNKIHEIMKKNVPNWSKK